MKLWFKIALKLATKKLLIPRIVIKSSENRSVGTERRGVLITVFRLNGRKNSLDKAPFSLFRFFWASKRNERILYKFTTTIFISTNLN